MPPAKKHQVPQVPAKGGGTKDRSRDEDGEWRQEAQRRREAAPEEIVN